MHLRLFHWIWGWTIKVWLVYSLNQPFHDYPPSPPKKKKYWLCGRNGCVTTMECKLMKTWLGSRQVDCVVTVDRELQGSATWKVNQRDSCRVGNWTHPIFLSGWKWVLRVVSNRAAPLWEKWISKKWKSFPQSLFAAHFNKPRWHREHQHVIKLLPQALLLF